MSGINFETNQETLIHYFNCFPSKTHFQIFIQFDYLHSKMQLSYTLSANVILFIVKNTVTSQLIDY